MSEKSPSRSREILVRTAAAATLVALGGAACSSPETPQPTDTAQSDSSDRDVVLTEQRERENKVREAAIESAVAITSLALQSDIQMEDFQDGSYRNTFQLTGPDGEMGTDDDGRLKVPEIQIDFNPDAKTLSIGSWSGYQVALGEYPSVDSRFVDMTFAVGEGSALVGEEKPSIGDILDELSQHPDNFSLNALSAGDSDRSNGKNLVELGFDEYVTSSDLITNRMIELTKGAAV